MYRISFNFKTDTWGEELDLKTLITWMFLELLDKTGVLKRANNYGYRRKD